MRVKKTLTKEEYLNEKYDIEAQININGDYEVIFNYDETKEERENRIINNIIKYLGSDCIHGEGCVYDYENYVIATNWNNHKKLADYIENCDFIDLDWDDECSYCSECCKVISTSPNYYGDQKNFIITEYGLACRECVEKNPELLINEYINNNNKAVPFWGIDIILENGFICLDGEDSCKIFENGWYPGQTDDPVEIVKKLNKELGFDIHDKYDLIWYLDSVGQFDIHFSLFMREK